MSLLEDERVPEAPVAEPVDDTPAAPPTAPPEPVLATYARWFVAICAFAAAALHVVAMIDHVDHHPTLGRAFLTVALLQVAWGALVVRSASRALVVLGMLGTAAFSLIWVFSRTKGISWFPGLEEVEPIGWRDLVTEMFQLLAIVGSAVLLAPRRFFAPNAGDEEPDSRVIAVMAVLAGAAVVVVYGATHGAAHVV